MLDVAAHECQRQRPWNGRTKSRIGRDEEMGMEVLLKDCLSVSTENSRKSERASKEKRHAPKRSMKTDCTMMRYAQRRPDVCVARASLKISIQGPRDSKQLDSTSA
jgi:hypothetical protein